MHKSTATVALGVGGALIFALALGALLVNRMPVSTRTATILDGVPSLTAIPAPMETTFPETRSVVWEGTVIGTLAGGRGIAVHLAHPSDGQRAFEAYFNATASRSVTGFVRVTGQWVGTSCAYAQTIFGGECVAEVDISNVEQLPIEPE
jgi:hypothetical protein